MNTETAAKLRAPFDEEQVGKLPKVTCSKCSKKECQDHKWQKCRTCKSFMTSAHTHLDYVGHAHVTERLLNVDPEWSWKPLAFTNSGLPATDDNGGLWIELTVGGKTMLGYGDAPGKRGGNAVKEAIGDAIRNAGMRFGIALDLWKKEPTEPQHDHQERPQEKPQTPEDRASELRGQIAAISKKAGKNIQEISEDFTLWSEGQDITKATVAVLAEYKDHLQREKA